MERKKFRRARRKLRSNAKNKPNNKPSQKRKQWMETKMTSALKEAKQSKKLYINRISKKYNVPRSTLQDRISSCVTHGTKPRPLTAEEEKSLTTHLIDAAKLGYGKTRKIVNRMAENVAREKGTLRKEKYPMDGGENLLSDSHNFLYVSQIPQFMSV